MSLRSRRDGRPAPSRVDLVATDLDGTLLRSDGTVSPRTREALAAAEAAGIPVVMVTGRPPRWMDMLTDVVGRRGLAVCANGALVYDLPARRVVSSRTLSPAAAAEVVQALSGALPGLTFAGERLPGPDGGTTFVREPTYRTRFALEHETVLGRADLVGEPLVKLLARSDSHGPDELLGLARAAVADTAATLTHSSSDGLLEISAAGVSKASGLAALAAESGLTAGSVMAFGDMPNDLPLLAWAGWSVATANAHPEVLALADEVTADHDDDGVARVLERLLAP